MFIQGKYGMNTSRNGVIINVFTPPQKKIFNLQEVRKLWAFSVPVPFQGITGQACIKSLNSNL